MSKLMSAVDAAYRTLLRPLVFRLDPETAHRRTLQLLAALPYCEPSPPDPTHAVQLAGLTLPGPIGLAAGFDKNAEAPDAWFALGCGFVEIGTVTPLPQAGNPTPRVFRLPEDRAMINRLGFPGEGVHAVRQRLEQRRHRVGVIGANLGANKDSDDRIGDYALLIRTLRGCVDYFTINISSPNTPGLRDLQSRENLQRLLGRLREAAGDDPAPLFVKLAPDFESDAERIDTAGAAVEFGAQALILSNTTVRRPALHSKHAAETGGLSGAPLFDETLRIVRTTVAAGLNAPIIAVGGIDSPAKAAALKVAGAAAVQIYTGLVYEGPGLIRRCSQAFSAAV